MVFPVSSGRGRRQRYLLALAASFVVIFIACGGFLAHRVAASTLSQAVKINTKVSRGNLVTLSSSQEAAGVLASVQNGNGLLGVVVENDDSLLAINPSHDTVQVAVGGTAPVLVSTLNGPVHSGDRISVSPIAGMGMKAEPGLPLVGYARSDLSAQTADVAERSVKDEDGSVKRVFIGFVNVEINVHTSDLQANAASASRLQTIVRQWTGRDVSLVRIIVALVITVVTLITLSILTYSSIYGSIISIGRNPLAKLSIFRTLRSVLFLELVLGVVAAVLIIFLLR
jgi:hypothetical protein